MNDRVRGSASTKATGRIDARLTFVIALACAGLLPAVGGPWILDDDPLIATNPRVQALTMENVRFLLTHVMWDLDLSMAQARIQLGYFRPLVMLSYAFDWWLGGGSSVTFHVTNVVLHASTILLAGRALRRWSGSRAGAWLGAAYFGLHPARAESAAWISGRPDLLATLAMLVCLEGVHLLRRGTRAGSVLLFFAGLVVAFASKETALVLPVLVAIELATAERPAALRPFTKAWPLWASSAAALCYLVARQVWNPIRPFPIKGLSLAAHVGFVFETLGRATMYLLAPFDLSLSGAMLTERGGKVLPDSRYLLLGVASFLVIVVALMRTRRSRPRAFWSLVAFLVSIAPTLNLVWIGGVGLTAARFFYLPSLLLAWFGIELGKDRFRSVAPRLATMLTHAGVVTLALLLGLQSTTYASADRFWASELRSRPDVPANIEYFVKRDWARGEPERALARSLCAYQVASERFSFMGEGALIILITLKPWAKLLPDARRAELAAIADFLAAVREPSGPAVLQLELLLDVPPESRVRSELVSRAPEAQTQEAAIRVRLGEPERALALVRAARAACPRCRDLLDLQAYVAYQAFDADLAEQLAHDSLEGRWGQETKRARITRLRELNRAIEDASGIELLQLRVQRLGELELYGEALRLLEREQRAAPDRADDPGLLRTMLGLAALAGDAHATERLARQVQLAAPPLPPQPSLDRTKQHLSQLRDGCAFPEELQ